MSHSAKPDERFHQRIAAALTEKINSGELPDGARLPSERELAAAFGASRNTVRNALLSLQAAGLIAVPPKSRARVTQLNNPAFLKQLSGAAQTLLARPNGMADFWEARVLFECGLARYAAQHASQKELDRLIAQFRRGCADRNSDLERWRACSRRLYDLLIAPISRDLPKGQPLLVELDAELSSIPFAALLDPEGRYFGETQTLSDFPGTAYLRRLREPGTLASSDTAVAVGEPAIASEFASAFSALPEAADEARAVACRFQNATLLTGAEATRQNLERKLTSVIVFHFAGHSVANADRVSLLLAPGDGKESKRESSSVLNALDVKTDLLKRCSLAVFSACSSSGLEGDGAADPESLVRVFLDAGVPWVIASGWDVDSHATARFMNALYRRLLAGDRAPAAMRDAAREVRRQPETAHPYYWAAFRLYGRT